MAFSMYSMVTGSSLMDSTHDASQGAGQILPVNSGKLLVPSNEARASFQRPRYTRSFQSGITLPRGHPLWQKGTAQFMHRAPCFLMSSSGHSS